MRFSGRKKNEMRNIEIIPDYLAHADGSCLISVGKTVVLCTATVEEKVPPFLKKTGQGWATAEYSMIPCSTKTRTDREVVKGYQSGRTHEIQRFIGRSVRSTLDLKALGERQIKVDCDVIQADGGTRTASVCGACVAVGFAIKRMRFKYNPFRNLVGAISCGIVNGELVVDLDYDEDSSAEVDANFVMVDTGNLVEILASGERCVFTNDQLFEMIGYARESINKIFEIQKKILLS